MIKIGQIDAFLRTDQGQVRDHNEDYIAFWEPEQSEEEGISGRLYIVADGVGGADAGEVASEYASTRTIYHYKSMTDTQDLGQRLADAMQAANTDLRQLVAGQDGRSRMATTMVAAVIHGRQATIGNVGDSRGYHWQNGLLYQVTRDQSLVARLLEEGAITEEEALNHPRKNVILHSLGSENTPPIDLYQVDLAVGERLILCSDGLTRHVSDTEIADIAGQQTPSEATQTLIDLANARGGEDNISVAILYFGEQPAQTEHPTVSEPAGLESRQESDRRTSRGLWYYTFILCLIQIILIVLVWYIINN